MLYIEAIHKLKTNKYHSKVSNIYYFTTGTHYPDGDDELPLIAQMKIAMKVTLWQNIVVFSRKEPRVARLTSQDLVILQLCNKDHQTIHGTLENSNWNVSKVNNAGSIPPCSKILILDELEAPVMSNPGKRQWEILQYLVDKECHILWVTAGAQFSVTDPDKALINGLFGTIRNETPFLTLLNLNVDNVSGTAAVSAIKQCLDFFNNTENKSHTDTDYAERDGILHISHILPDVVLNRSSKEDLSGRPAEIFKTPEARSS